MVTIPEFRIMLDAGPPGRTCRRLRIVIANNQVLSPVQRAEQFGAVAGFRDDVSQMPHVVVNSDERIPIVNECGIVIRNIVEGTAIDLKNTRVAEVGVASKVYHV